MRPTSLLLLALFAPADVLAGGYACPVARQGEACASSAATAADALKLACACLRATGAENQKRLSRAWISPAGADLINQRVSEIVGELDARSRRLASEKRAASILGDLRRAEGELLARMTQDDAAIGALEEAQLQSAGLTGDVAATPSESQAPPRAPPPSAPPAPADSAFAAPDAPAAAEPSLNAGDVFPEPSGEPRVDAFGAKTYDTPRGELTIKDGLRSLAPKSEDGAETRLFEVRGADGAKTVRAVIRERDPNDSRLTLTTTEQYGPDGKRAWTSEVRSGLVDGRQVFDQRTTDASGRVQARLQSVREDAGGGKLLETSTVRRQGQPDRTQSSLTRGGKLLERGYRSGDGPTTTVRYDASQKPVQVEPGMLQAGPGRRRVDLSELERYRVLSAEQLKKVQAELAGAEGLLNRSGRVSPLVQLEAGKPQVDFLVQGNRGQPSHLLSFKDGDTVIRPGVDAKGRVSDGRAFAELGIASPGRWNAMIPVAPSPGTRLAAVVIPKDQGSGAETSVTYYEVKGRGVAGTYALTVTGGRLASAVLPTASLDWFAQNKLVRPSEAANLAQDLPAGLGAAKDRSIQLLFHAAVRHPAGGIAVPPLTEIVVRGTDERSRAVTYTSSMQGAQLMTAKVYEDQGQVSKYVAVYNGPLDAATGRGAWVLRQVFESTARPGEDGQLRLVRSMNQWERPGALKGSPPGAGGWVKDAAFHSFRADEESAASKAAGWLAMNPVARGLGWALSSWDKAYDLAQEGTLRAGGSVLVKLGLMDPVDYEVVAAATRIQRSCAGDPRCAAQILGQYGAGTQRAAGAIMDERSRTAMLHAPADALVSANLTTGRALPSESARVEALASGFSLQHSVTALNERGGAGYLLAATLVSGRTAWNSLPFELGGVVAGRLGKVLDATADAAASSGGLVARLPALAAPAARVAEKGFGKMMTANLALDGAASAARAVQACGGGNQADCVTEVMTSAINLGGIPGMAKVKANQAAGGAAAPAPPGSPPVSENLARLPASREATRASGDGPGPRAPPAPALSETQAGKLRQVEKLWRMSDVARNDNAPQAREAALKAVSLMRAHGLSPEYLSAEGRGYYQASRPAETRPRPAARVPPQGTAAPAPEPPPSGPAGALEPSRGVVVRPRGDAASSARSSPDRPALPQQASGGPSALALVPRPGPPQVNEAGLAARLQDRASRLLGAGEQLPAAVPPPEPIRPPAQPMEFGGKGGAEPQRLALQAATGEAVAFRVLTEGSAQGAYVRATFRPEGTWEVLAQGERLALRPGSEVALGRSPGPADHRVVLGGNEVSREHLRLRLGENGRLEAVESSVNGSEVSRVLSADGRTPGRQQGFLDRVFASPSKEGGGPGELIRIKSTDFDLVRLRKDLEATGVLDRPSSKDPVADVARRVLELSRKQMGYDDGFKVKLKGGVEVPSDRTVMLGQVCKGVCRDQALVAGALVEQLLKDGKLPGARAVHYVVGDGHAWVDVELKPSISGGRPGGVIIDPAQGYSGSPDAVFNGSKGERFRYSEFGYDALRESVVRNVPAGSPLRQRYEGPLTLRLGGEPLRILSALDLAKHHPDTARRVGKAEGYFVLDPADPRNARPLVEGRPLVVGREGEFALRPPAVSRRHVELSREGDVLTIKDLGSANGTAIELPLAGGGSARPVAAGLRAEAAAKRELAARLRGATPEAAAAPAAERVRRQSGASGNRGKDLERAAKLEAEAGALEARARSFEEAARPAAPSGWRAAFSRLVEAVLPSAAKLETPAPRLSELATGAGWSPSPVRGGRAVPPNWVRAGGREFRKVAEGGDGVVYRDGSDAIKLPRPERGASEAHVRELSRLANDVLAKLPGFEVVPVEPVRLADGSWGIGTRWVEGETLPQALSRLNPDAGGPVYRRVPEPVGVALPPKLAEYNRLLARAEAAVVEINRATGGHGRVFESRTGGLEDMWWNSLDQRAEIPFGNFILRPDGRLVNIDPISLEKLVDRMPGAAADPAGYAGAPPSPKAPAPAPPAGAAPAPPAARSALDALREGTRRLKDPSFAANASGSPRVFAELAFDALDPARRGVQGPPLGAAELSRAQSQLGALAEAVARKIGRDPASVVATATDHAGALGIIEKGFVAATSPQGDAPAVWGGRIHQVTPYARGPLADGKPAALVLFEDRPSTRLSGDRLAGEPRLDEVLAVVVTDGRKATVFDRAALKALNSSARELERAATANPRLLETRAKLLELLAVKNREGVHELGGAGQRLTRHGAERVADLTPGRPGTLSLAELERTRKAGKLLRQGDGARVYLHEVAPGKFNVLVENPESGRLITTHRHFSARVIGQLTRRYGWTE